MSEPKKRRRVGLVDVARHAGVSAQTVSRVVHGSHSVAPETRAAVEAAISELGYQPNLAARSLASRRTGVLQLLITSSLDFGQANSFIAISESAHAAGYHLATTTAAHVSVKGVLRPEYLQQTSVTADALIVLGGHDANASVAVQMASRMPVVLMLAGKSGLDGIATVSLDQIEGAKLATRHLIEAGARRIVHIGGPQEWVDSGLRLQGFEQTCVDAGVSHSWVGADSWDASAGYRIGRDLLSTPDRPDGVFAANDHLALGFMRAAHELGVGVGEECAVVGFDDSAGSANYYPPLTSVSQGFANLGRTAVAQARSMLAGSPPADVVLSPKLVVRASSKLKGK